MIVCEQRPMHGVVVLRSEYEDDIGEMETYNYERLKEYGISEKFVQENESKSTKGVLRGLHFQKQYAQAQIVRVLKGSVFDVVVDIRRDSSTFGNWFGIYLRDSDHRMVYMSNSFAHGFLTISDTAVMHYKCSQFYHSEDEGGIRYDDPLLGICWPYELVGGEHNIRVSDKDMGYPKL